MAGVLEASALYRVEVSLPRGYVIMHIAGPFEYHEGYLDTIKAALKEHNGGMVLDIRRVRPAKVYTLRGEG